MRRVLLACSVLLALTTVSAALTVDETRTRLHADAIGTFHPRLEGSAGEQQVIRYIEDVLERSNIEYNTMDFSDATSGHSFSRVIEAFVPGTGAGTLMLVAPIDHAPDQSPGNDGSASLAAMLSVLEAAANEQLSTDLRIVFVGADRRDRGPQALGSVRFLDTYFPDGNHALLYLDLSGASIRLTAGADGTVAPWWLVQRTLSAGETSGVSIASTAGLNQIHRLGISDAPRALSRFLAAGIPSLYLDSVQSDSLTLDPSEDAVAITRLLGNFISEFADGVPSDWDRHYLQFELANRFIVVPETFFVTALIGVLLIALLYALIFRRRFVRYAKTIGRNLWNLPLLFFLIFLFLSAATYAVELFLRLRDFEELWTYYPVAYVSMKGFFAIFLFTVASQFFRSLPLSKNGSFYSAASLSMLFVDVVLFSIINISFGHYFIWAFLAAFIFSVVANRTAKVIALLLAPLLLVQAVVSVLQAGDNNLAELLLRSAYGDLFLSFVALPFLLMLIRLDFLFRHPVRGKRSFALRLVSISSGVLVSGMIAFVLFSSPFSTTKPQPVTAVETIDYRELTHSLELSSPAPLGKIALLFEGEEYLVDTRATRWTQESPLLPDVLSARLNYERFIDRERASLVIDSPAALQSLSVTLFSEQTLQLFDVSFPFQMSPDQRQAEIFIGNRPPLPLIIDYTVSADQALPGVEIRATSSNHPSPLEIHGTNISVTTTLEVVTRFEQ